MINENKQLPFIWKTVDAPFKHIDCKCLLQRNHKFTLLISVSKDYNLEVVQSAITSYIAQ